MLRKSEPAGRSNVPQMRERKTPAQEVYSKFLTKINIIYFFDNFCNAVSTRSGCFQINQN